MISTLILFFFHKFRTKQSLFKLIVAEFISSISTLFLITYSSKAVMFKNDLSNIDYASFLLIGEAALILPLTLFSAYLEKAQYYKENQFLQTLIGLKIDFRKILFLSASTDLILPALRICLFVFVACTFYSAHLTTGGFLLFLLVQMLGLKCFMMMGHMALELYQTWNLKPRWFHYLNSMLAIVGGAYFPVSVFPPFLVLLLSYLNPQTLILNLSRSAFANSEMSNQSEALFALSILTFMTYLLGHFSSNYLKNIRLKNNRLI